LKNHGDYFRVKTIFCSFSRITGNVW